MTWAKYSCRSRKQFPTPSLAEAGLIGDLQDGNTISTSTFENTATERFQEERNQARVSRNFQEKMALDRIHKRSTQTASDRRGGSEYTGTLCRDALARKDQRKKKVSWRMYSVSTAQKNNYSERSWGLAEGKIILDTRGPPFYRSCNRWTAFIHLKVVE